MITSEIYSFIEQVNKEQRRQIEIHKWIQSERAHQDLSDTAIYEWVEKYADAFRKWALSIPSQCINCGYCGQKKEGLCVSLFNEKRLKLIDEKKEPQCRT